MLIRRQNQTADQKAEHERKKQEEALAKREADITLRELKAAAFESLAEKGLPKELEVGVNYESASTVSTSIDAIEKAFRAAVEAGVNERLKGSTPKTGDPKVSPKNPFARETLNLTEQGRLFRTDPQKAAALAKQAGISLNI